MIIYSKSSGFSNAAIGKIETPVKMIIEHESQALSKKPDIVSTLFNVERSNRFGETIVGGNEFDVFRAAEEGAGAHNDSIYETYHKFIEHIQFMKEFTITAEMMEDANYGIAADAKRRAENFTRAYYKTMNKIAEAALVNATSTTTVFANAHLDLTAPDSIALFSSNHYYGEKNQGNRQSNFFWGDIFSSGSADNRTPSTKVDRKSVV